MYTYMSLFIILSSKTDKYRDGTWILIARNSTVELRWLELVGTVGASSTHPCVRAILSLTNLKFGSCVLYVISDTTFFSTKVAKRM